MAKVQFIHRSGRVEDMEKRYASILQKLGRGTYMTRDMRAQSAIAVDAAAVLDDCNLAALRAEYQSVVGKRPYHGWDEQMLRGKISEHRNGAAE